jgi:hypothetical protein
VRLTRRTAERPWPRLGVEHGLRVHLVVAVIMVDQGQIVVMVVVVAADDGVDLAAPS